jgi:UDP-glucose 4-epimerase
MRVVVFGGAGFVGLNVAQRMVQEGHEVVAFDRQPVPAAAAFGPGFTSVTGDVTAPGDLAAALRGADAVVHGAAITSDATREAHEPRRVLEVNLMGFLKVLEAARAAGVRRVVNLSSAGAYGAAGFGDASLDEATTPPDPRSLYGLTKFASERVGARLAELWGLDVRSLRLSAVFGPWERATGVRDTLSPPFQVAEALLAGKPALLERHDVRDWLYAPDVAAAVHALLVHPAPRFDLYNVSLGDTYDLCDWGERLATALGGGEVRLAEPGETPNVRSHGAVSRQPMRTERLRDDLGVTASFGRDASAAHYAAWIEDHPQLMPRRG